MDILQGVPKGGLDGGGPDRGPIFQDAVAGCFVSVGYCFGILSPVGASQCFENVHLFFVFGCDMFDVTGEVSMLFK